MADNQFVCPPCGEHFASQEDLKAHAQQHHSSGYEADSTEETEEHKHEHQE